MAKKSVTIRRSPKTGQFMLRRSRGEKISAVEGMILSARMVTILDDGAQRGLSGDALRARIKAQARKK